MTVLPHQSSLSREERERIRREATLRRNTAWILDVAVGILRESPNCARFSETEADVLLREVELVPRLEAALEQAERERDEERRRFHQLFIEHSANHDRLAKVPALVEALKLSGEQFAYIAREAGGDNNRRRIIRASEQGIEETASAVEAWDAE